MTSPNEAKLEELKKEIKSVESYGAMRDIIDRAFQLGRMEQHDRDVDAVEKSYDGESALTRITTASGPKTTMTSTSATTGTMKIQGWN